MKKKAILKLTFVVLFLVLANALFAGQGETQGVNKGEEKQELLVRITQQDKMRAEYRVRFTNKVVVVFNNKEYIIPKSEFLFKASTPKALAFYKKALEEYNTTIVNYPKIKRFLERAAKHFNSWLSKSKANRDKIARIIIERNDAEIKAKREKEREEKEFRQKLKNNFKNRRIFGLGVNINYGLGGGSPSSNVRTQFQIGANIIYFIRPPYHLLNFGFSILGNYFVAKSYKKYDSDDDYLYKAFNLTGLFNFSLSLSKNRHVGLLFQFGYSKNFKIEGEYGETDAIVGSIGYFSILVDLKMGQIVKFYFKFPKSNYLSSSRGFGFGFSFSLFYNFL